MADDEETQLQPLLCDSDKENDVNRSRYAFFTSNADFEGFLPRKNTEEIIQNLRHQAEWSCWIMESHAKLKAAANTANQENGEERRLRLEAERQTKALHGELAAATSQLTEANNTIARICEAVVHNVHT